MLHDNPIRGRINAWFLAFLDGYLHWKYGAVKTSLLEEAPATLVEIGPGPGANMRYIPKGSKLIAVEPNVHMHPILKRKAVKYNVNMELRALEGEQLDLATDSVDFVFCSLVLCTVKNPQQVISEIRRVLKPGGRFVCIEHVEAPQNSVVHRIQHTVKKPWFWFFEGCDLCRNTGHLLESSGFQSVEVKKFILPTVFVPIRHQVVASCIN